MSMFG